MIFIQIHLSKGAKFMPTVFFFQLFSKSVLDIKTRLVVTVGLGTKWIPDSDSPSNFIAEYKFLGY